MIAINKIKTLILIGLENGGAYSTDTALHFNDIVRNVKNSLYWIKNTSALKKPWIIGEIGFAGTNDTILTCSKDPVSIICPGFVATPTTTTYERLQRDFCDTTHKDVRACGGSGYSWWDYQDSREYAGDGCAGAHWGIFTNCHEPKEIINPPENNLFLYNWGSMPCGNFVNPDMMSVFYYNHFPNWNTAITGFVVDLNSQEPMSNAYIEGMYFDNDSILLFGNKTFTDSNGYFSLALNPGIDTPPNFLIISAMGKEREHVFDPPVQHDDIYTVHNLSCKPYGEPGEFGLPDNDNFKSEINKINKSSLYPKTKIYPNPTTGMVSIEFYLTQSSIVRTEVQNLIGNTIRSSEFGTLTAGNYNRKLDLSDLPNGIYIIKFNGNNNTEMFKIIINK
ncbi:MAG: T9SS type A sorting domain-containing protein [Bacteroidales bacterium]|nr:T9SS type A sorting domain-containing protein [Bacteroidales bacterium]